MKNLILIPSVFEASMIDRKPGLREYIKLSDKLVFGICGIAKTGISFTEEIIKKENIEGITLLGLCGDLQKSNRIATVHKIRCVSNRTHNIDLETIPLEAWKTSSSLLTVGKPVCTEKRKENLSSYAELVDMETYHYAALCKGMGLKAYAVRIVSDNCDRDLRPFFSLKVPGDEYMNKALKKLSDCFKVLVSYFTN